jgi:hypothetical protein
MPIDMYQNHIDEVRKELLEKIARGPTAQPKEETQSKE